MNSSIRFSSGLRQGLSALAIASLLAISYTPLSFVPTPLAKADPPPPPPPENVQIDKINGHPPTGFCIAGPITIEGSGITGNNGGKYSVDIGWGTGSPATTTIDLNGGGNIGSHAPFTFSAGPHVVGSSLTIFLHHSTATGNDEHTTVLHLCAAAPTEGVVVLAKNVVGGSAQPSDFTLTINGNNVVGSSTGAAPGVKLTAGSYLVTESGPANYTQTNFSCTDNDVATSTSGSTINVSAGHNYFCTVANTFQPATTGGLIVVKHVANGETGATTTASAFTLHVKQNDSDVAGSPQAGSESGTNYTLPGGTYVVSEETFAGYTPAFSGSCDANGTVTITNGATTTCTLTNTAQAPTITIEKTVVNDNGGTKTEGDFSFLLDGVTSLFHNIAAATSVGAHTVSESPFFGYSASVWGGDCAANGSVTLALGQSATCSITNDDEQATLTVVKTVNNNHGGQKKPGDFQIHVLKGDSDVDGSPQAGSEEGTVYHLDAGTYIVSEDELSGYTGVVGGDCIEGSITLAPGDEKTCTVVNNDIGPGLTVIKNVINDNGGTALASDFQIHVLDVNASSTDAGGSPAAGSEAGVNYSNLNAGPYQVHEDPTEGYIPAYSGDCDQSGNVTLEVGGEPKVCVVTNNDVAGNLTITKNTDGADATFTFALMQGATTTASPQITTSGGTGSVSMPLDSGDYTVVENVPAQWALQTVQCLYDNESVGSPVPNGEAISITPGSSVTCTFTDRATAADLSVQKSVDDETPDNGQQVTFTLTASNAGPGATTGAQVTDLLPAGLDYVSDSGDGTYDNTSGVWDIGNLAAGASAEHQIVATVSASAGTALTNTAKITLNDEGLSDDNPDNDSSSVDLTVNTPGVVTKPQCSDGIDNDGDGQIDFPADSGCSSADDDSERNVGGSGGGGGATTPFVGGGLVLGTSTEATECPMYLHEYIKFGAQNNPSEVTLLQQFLNNFEANNLALTGVYDDPTHSAVYAFQTKYLSDIMSPWGATKASGYVYYTTRKEINTIYCHFTREFPLDSQQQAEIARWKASGASYNPDLNAGNGSAPSGVQLPSSPSTPSDQSNPEVGGASTGAEQSAAAANASTTGNWWSNFWKWLFGK